MGAAANIINPDYNSWHTDDPNAAAVQENTGLRYFPNLGILFGTVDENGVNELRSHTAEVSDLLSPPEMSLIHPVEDAALAGPNPGNSWALERLQVPFLWDKGLTGEGILIGHLDTGVDKAHPAISGSVDSFAEFDAIGRLVASAPTADSGFHGTHTAGILIGKPYEGVTFGVAPGAKLAAATVIEHGADRRPRYRRTGMVHRTRYKNRKPLAWGPTIRTAVLAYLSDFAATKHSSCRRDRK